MRGASKDNQKRIVKKKQCLLFTVEVAPEAVKRLFLGHEKERL